MFTVPSKVEMLAEQRPIVVARGPHSQHTSSVPEHARKMTTLPTDSLCNQLTVASSATGQLAAVGHGYMCHVVSVLLCPLANGHGMHWPSLNFLMDYSKLIFKQTNLFNQSSTIVSNTHGVCLLRCHLHRLHQIRQTRTLPGKLSVTCQMQQVLLLQPAEGRRLIYEVVYTIADWLM